MCVRVKRRACFSSPDRSPRATGNKDDAQGSNSCLRFIEEETENTANGIFIWLLLEDIFAGKKPASYQVLL